MNFKKHIESSNDEAALLNGIRSGDELSFQAYLDFLEENGREIPRALEVWRKPVDSNNFHVRWMVLPRHMPEVLMMEKLGAKSPASGDEILKALNDRTVLGYVATSDDERVLGYCICRMSGGNREIHRILVHPLIRNKGVGGRILQRLMNPRQRLTAFHSDDDRGFTTSIKFIQPTATACSTNEVT